MRPKRYNDDVKRIVTLLYESGISARKISKVMDVSDSSVYKWIKLYRKK